jgi:apolipoprotein D and lipocalin family protein
MILPRSTRWLPAALAAVLLVACAGDAAPMATVPHVDLARFMGDWRVIGNIPTFIERDAYNAVENYRMESDGSIATTFTFNRGGFDGPQKRHTPRGFVLDTRTNATWGMRFVWPLKADYRIIYLTPDYSVAVIGRAARDYVWIMARAAHISDAAWQSALQATASAGYDIAKVQKVPQA